MNPIRSSRGISEPDRLKPTNLAIPYTNANPIKLAIVAPAIPDGRVTVAPAISLIFSTAGW